MSLLLYASLFKSPLNRFSTFSIGCSTNSTGFRLLHSHSLTSPVLCLFIHVFHQRCHFHIAHPGLHSSLLQIRYLSLPRSSLVLILLILSLLAFEDFLRNRLFLISWLRRNFSTLCLLFLLQPLPLISNTCCRVHQPPHHVSPIIRVLFHLL